ncbi:hypothetical protein E1193_13385 [Micromonospora sp. KC606]|uniref:hypothetical protein n=1 Tax=Micromonospora sp. KC606 TaxID=2530379 RepID=UPI00104C68E4|nr:hypothetical protein [Micromonospora sp. KC606]TDC81891.1 hypothetical protein E1193_13385 [Micromonospora sp. KC606]
MSENAFKGVTVRVPANTMTNEVRHESATTIDVSDGHLQVKKSGSSTKTIAIYAPGKWLSAVVSQ